jgi:hypothetical protein
MMRRQTAVDPISQALAISATFLLVPMCIVLGFRLPAGELIVSGGAALLVSILYWIVLGGTTYFFEYSPLVGRMSPSTLLPSLLPALNVSTLILLVAACALAIRLAVISGHWLWAFFVAVAGYISVATAYLIFYIPQACFSYATRMPPAISTLLCGNPNSLRPLLVDLAHVVGPVGVLIYALVAIRTSAGATRPAAARVLGGRRGSPPGMYISPISAGALEEDTQPMVH